VRCCRNMRCGIFPMYLVCIFFTMQLLSMVAELCKNPARRMCVCSGNTVRIFRVFRNIHVLFQYPCSQASHHSNIWQSQLDAKKKVRKMHVQKKNLHGNGNMQRNSCAHACSASEICIPLREPSFRCKAHWEYRDPLCDSKNRKCPLQCAKQA